MSKDWDNGSTAFDPEFWREVLRVLKPGGHIAAFGGTRSYHRLACAIEDAGAEIRDCLMWHHATGFPKSKNLGGDWAGWGSALKPATEIICLARKNLSEVSIAANVLRWGTGALNIDATRIATDDGYQENAVTQGINTAQTSYAPAVVRRTFEPSHAGRWPANLCHDGSDEVVGMFPDSKSGVARSGHPGGHTFGGGEMADDVVGTWCGDEGSAARFFFSAKASKDDRMNTRHPTTKPVALMRWLCRLVTPPGGIILEPFGGSGSTAIACVREGFRCIIAERELEYVEMIRHRLAHLGGEDAPLFAAPQLPQIKLL